MSEREAFLRAIAANEGDHLVRLVFADWLDEHGEHEEADRQRRWPEAKAWLDELCRKLNARGRAFGETSVEQLLEFGRRVSATESAEVVFSIDGDDFPDGGGIVAAMRDQIPEFWKAWAVVAGSPVPPNVERKSYVDAEWACCAHEVYPEKHLAGPKPERFLRAEEEEARSQREAELNQQRTWEEQFELVRDELEKDRP